MPDVWKVSGASKRAFAWIEMVHASGDHVGSTLHGRWPGLQQVVSNMHSHWPYPTCYCSLIRPIEHAAGHITPHSYSSCAFQFALYRGDGCSASEGIDSPIPERFLFRDSRVTQATTSYKAITGKLPYLPFLVFVLRAAVALKDYQLAQTDVLL